MRKYLLLFIQFTFLSFYINGQGIPTVVPLNFAYIEYLNNFEKSKDNLRTESGYYLGEIPIPFELNFDNTYYPITKTIPASYDLRTVNSGAYLTPVKNQGNSGTCWAFTAYAALESYWKKIGLPEYDLSEKNMATCDGFNRGPNAGGNYLIPTAYLIRGSGPVNDADDPYNLPANAYCISGLTPVAYVAQMRNLPGLISGHFEPDIVKQAVMDYGALYVNMHWADNYYSNSNSTFFYNGTANPNHAVALVGWDDNKVVTGGSAATPSGNGAWIIKNSWGENFGEAGYFYISYEDARTLINIAFFPSHLDYKHNVEIHSYDELGSSSSAGYGDGDDYALIKFTASKDQQIEKFGTYAIASNTILSFDVYSSFDGSILTGLLSSLDNQICDLPGYYTFDLTNPVSVNAGNDFYVRVRYQSAETYPIPIEMNTGGIYSNAVIETGKCWVSNNGSSWMAIGGSTSYEWDLCIKAYGAFTGCLPTEASTASSFKYKAEIEWESPESEFEMEYGIAPYSFTGNANKENINDTMCLLTSLKHSTPYEYKIRSVCGGGQISEWSSTRKFSTSCESITVFPYIEDFNASHVCPPCWNIHDYFATEQIWAFGQKTGGLNGTTGNYAYVDSDTYGEGWGQNTDLMSPTFDFSGYSDVNLSFQHYFRSAGSESATLYYSTDNGTNWTQLQQWTNTTTNPVTYNQTIAALTDQSQVKFKWNYYGLWGWYWFVDDIQVTATASNSLIVSNTTHEVNSNMAYQNVTVEPDGNLTVAADIILTITDNLIIKSDASGSGSFIDDGILIVQGGVFVEKYLASSNPVGWPVASPVADAPHSVFDGDVNTYFYNALAADWNIFQTGNNMDVMKGYWTKFNADKTLVFNNDLNTNNIVYTELYRTGYQAGNYGWNLIGNPYPSYIDWDMVVALPENTSEGTFSETTKLRNAVYVLKEDGNYQSFVNGAGTNGFTGRISPSTAFWVQVIPEITHPVEEIGCLTFNNQIRVHNGTTPNKALPENLLKLKLCNGVHADETIIRMAIGAVTNFDPAYDAVKMFSQNNALPQIYTLIENNEKLSINTIHNIFNEAVAIPIAYKNEIGEELSIIAENVFSFSEEIALYLEDKHENVIQDLRQNNHYIFTPHASFDEERFVLHMLSTNTELSNVLNTNNINIYTAAKSLYVNAYDIQTDIAIYNLLGQIIYQQSLSGSGLHKINLNVAAGTYVVSLKDNSGIIFNTKVFIE